MSPILFAIVCRLAFPGDTPRPPRRVLRPAALRHERRAPHIAAATPAATRCVNHVARRSAKLVQR